MNRHERSRAEHSWIAFKGGAGAHHRQLPALLVAELLFPMPKAPDTLEPGAETTPAAVVDMELNPPTDEAVADAEPGPGPADMDCEPPGMCPLIVKPVGLFDTEMPIPLPATVKPWTPIEAATP